MSKVMDESSFNRNNVFTHLVLDEQELGSSSKWRPKHVDEVFAKTSFINMAKVMDESSCNWNNYSAFLDGALAPAEARMNVFLNGECKSWGPGGGATVTQTVHNWVSSDSAWDCLWSYPSPSITKKRLNSHRERQWQWTLQKLPGRIVGMVGALSMGALHCTHGWCGCQPICKAGARAGSSLDWYETSRPTCEILLGLS